MQELKENVARGAQLLDQVNPGWAREISPEYLDMCMAENCVLGQLYGGYDRGFIALRLKPFNDHHAYYEPAHYGFTLLNEGHEEGFASEWETLGYYWKKEVRRRLKHKAGANE